MRKIGLMGGTFDPIHLGHIMLGEQAYREYELDEVWFMPSRIPPHKKDHKITESEERCDMVELAIKNFPYFRMSDFELKREGGNTYTADTLRLLKEEYPEEEFYFIMGGDSVHDIEKWYHPEYVIANVIILAADRDHEDYANSLKEQIDYLNEKYHGDIRILHCKEMHVVSTEIRRRCNSDESLQGLVSEEVEAYIKEHGLYKD